ncbi:MAG: hypothetical protein SCH71_03675 [Desulfobulbaceae bacterium]|nr:hypothetical protein [Desulfobulbaceae bacterium]
MFANPMVIALMGGAVMTTAFMLYATGVGVQILCCWNRASASEAQLSLERKTYLVSSILLQVVGVQMLTFFLFILTVDRLHELFTGAMCAAGTLNANAYGYPVMGLKLAGFIGSGLWLIIRHVDAKAPDYPLIRIQYGLLCAVCVIWCFETFYLFRYFAALYPQIITSCCGTIFGNSGEGLAAETAHLSISVIRPGFWGLLVATLAAGAMFFRTRKGDWIFALLGTLMLPVSLAALISYICLYFYELPTHHCPFCLLQKEYSHVGYLLYASLLTGGVAAMGVGMLGWFKQYQSLRVIVPACQKRLSLVSIAGYAVFAVTAGYPMVFSDFMLLG